MGSEEVRALDNVSLRIEAGEFVAVMGASGSGKSTMLHILGFFDRPDTGAYLLNGTDISGLDDDQMAVLRNQIAGFVFQQFHLLPRISALANVALPLTYAGPQADRRLAAEKLSAVGLAARARHLPGELSGGERQRVAIARSLVNEPLIIFADEPTGNLDTRSEAEIMAILRQLNQQGKTIVMVTHELEVAEHAGRIITMRDGRIISDERKKDFKPVVLRENRSISQVLTRTGSVFGRAEFSDHVRQSLDAILANRLRSLLSMLGILIGVAAVIAMLALGQGARDSIEQRLSSLGSNLLMVRPGSSQMHGVALEAGTVTRFTLQDSAAMKIVNNVSRVSPSVRGRVQLVYGDKNWNSEVQGVGVEYPLMRSAVPVLGRFFDEKELLQRERVAVIGQTVASALFINEDPVGRSIRINRTGFRVIGVLPEKGASGFRDEDDTVLVPISTAMNRLLGKQYVDSIDVEVTDPVFMEQVQQDLKSLIIRRQNLSSGNEEAFQIRNMAELRQTLEATTQTMTVLLGSIAAISLLVGGIGIMNIMLVSVTERTREIGLRKAIGARRSDITAQFLIESILMTVAGGLAGVLLGVSAAFLLSVLAGWTTKVSWVSVVMATSFSVLVGIVFGLRPAMQAAGLNPVEALRYE
jgi:macrolide transport system ATP-binding/permease protein